MCSCVFPVKPRHNIHVSICSKVFNNIWARWGGLLFAEVKNNVQHIDDDDDDDGDDDDDVDDHDDHDDAGKNVKYEHGMKHIQKAKWRV